MNFRTKRFVLAVFLSICSSISISQADDDRQALVKSVVDTAIRPMMEGYRIPGMAIDIIGADKSNEFSYGLTSIETRQPVTRDTFFELGSEIKTVTAPLASYTQVSDALFLSNKVGQYVPDLQGRKLDDVNLLNLDAYTPGGLPLQVPENIWNDDQLM